MTSQSANKPRISRPVYAVAVLVLSAVLFVALNTFSNVGLQNARLDLTDRSLFTLSDGTRNIVQGLREPITLKFYYSEDVVTEIPALRAHAQRARDLLQEIAAASGGNVRVEEINPQSFSAQEDQATDAGLTGVPLRSGDKVFLGVVGTNTVDGREAIGFLAPERATYMEYDLARLIFSLATPEKPILGVVSNLPLDTGAGGLLLAMEGRSEPFMIYQELKNSFEVEFLEQDFDRIANEIKVLALVHPRELSPQTLYAIDQFVMRGGRVIAFIDPHSEVSLTAGPAGKPVQGYTEASNLPLLMQSWGVEMNPDEVLADRLRAQRVAAGASQRRQLTDYVLWQRLVSEDFDTDDPITAPLDALHIGSAGVLRPTDDATTTFTPIVTSTQDAMLIDLERVKSAPTPDALLRAFDPAGEFFTVAARISGPVKTAFPEGRPLADDEDEAPIAVRSSAHLLKTIDDANIVVFADSDLFDDRFWVQVQNFLGDRIAVPTADNAAFVVNAVENLMGSNDLISLRGREPADRPFTVVEDIRRDAEARFLAEEQRLQARIEETEARLAELRAELPDGTGMSALVTDVQEAEMQSLQRELAEGRRALRDVQGDLRRDVDALGARVAFINMALVPLLVGGVWLVLALSQRRRRRARAEAAGRAVTHTGAAS
ncbi:Gldg family protein [Pyruvatibacter sp.]|uniref:Gldg family protein n=1 Tax=Pyruvatibacter sp. TaxID=1981328 RepID=UPI0032ED6E93